MNKKQKKLYCYVDETGQDTKGKLFIVVAIVVENERDDLINKLEKAEKQTKKWKKKWFKTKKEIQSKYIELVLSSSIIKKIVYYQTFHQSAAYQDLTCLVVAKAINRYLEIKKIKNYKASVFVDGLSKKLENRISKILRDLGVKIRKVRGVRDEANAIIRLADSVAGMVREIDEDKNKFKSFKRQITELE